MWKLGQHFPLPPGIPPPKTTILPHAHIAVEHRAQEAACCIVFHFMVRHCVSCQGGRDLAPQQVPWQQTAAICGKTTTLWASWSLGQQIMHHGTQLNYCCLSGKTVWGLIKAEPSACPISGCGTVVIAPEVQGWEHPCNSLSVWDSYLRGTKMPSCLHYPYLIFWTAYKQVFWWDVLCVFLLIITPMHIIYTLHGAVADQAHFPNVSHLALR